MTNRRMTLGLVLAVAIAAVALDPGQASAQKRPFGIGLELGAPTGIGAKYYMAKRMAIQGGLGVIERVGSDGLHLYAEVLWHPIVLVRDAAFTMPLYAGIGGRFLQHDFHHDRCYDGRRYYVCDDDDTHLGVRVPFGILMDFNKVPLDVFFELAMIVDILHLEGDDDDYRHDDDTIGLSGMLGGRYYF